MLPDCKALRNMLTAIFIHSFIHCVCYKMGAGEGFFVNGTKRGFFRIHHPCKHIAQYLYALDEVLCECSRKLTRKKNV